MPIDIENFLPPNAFEDGVDSPSLRDIDLSPVTPTEPTFDIEPRRDNVLSINKPIFRDELENFIKQRPPNAPRRITKSVIIDKFDIKRTRIKLSPSVCDVCAFDIAAAKHGDWDGVPDRNKPDVLEALALHKKEQHPIKEDLIVYEDELPTEWLGSGNTL